MIVIWSDDKWAKRGKRQLWNCTSQFVLDPAVVLRARGPAGVVDSDIVTFARERLGFVVEPSQVAFLQSRAKRGIVNCSRQWGKTTLAALKAIYRALTMPRCLVLVAAPTERQSGLVLERVEQLAAPLSLRLKGDGYNKLSLKFPNDSRIVGLPGKEANIRGFGAVSLMIIDEAARVPDSLYKALRPMLAVGGGDLWVMSTPKGRSGFFYDEFEFGGERWERHQVAATECAPRITGEFLEEEVESMGAAWVKQEYFCEFVSSGGEMFDRVMVEEAVDPGLAALVF